MKFYCLFLLSFVVTNALLASPPLETVPHLDLSKYLGVRFEIASYPGPHQISVLNECRDKTLHGKWRRAEGKAWVVTETGKK